MGQFLISFFLESQRSPRLPFNLQSLCLYVQEVQAFQGKTRQQKLNNTPILSNTSLHANYPIIPIDITY